MNNMRLALLLLVIGCSKTKPSNTETKPAPAAKVVEEPDEGTAMALEEGAKTATPPAQDLPPIGDKLELQAAIGAAFQKRMYLIAQSAERNCDEIAASVKALHANDQPSHQRIATYASAHADELTAVTATLATDYATHVTNAKATLERCKDNKQFASVLAVPPWQVL